MAYLPSKKFIIIVLLILLVGGVFLFFQDKKTVRKAIFSGENFSLTNQRQGEKNWEEVLWEIASSSPGINVKIFAGSDSSGETGGLTKTDILARDFFANFLTLQQSGNLNDQTRQMLTESFIGSIIQNTFPDKYKLDDLKITKDESKGRIRIYGNALAGVIKEYSGQEKENDLVIINQALLNQDQQEMQKLNSIIKLYQGATSDLLNMEVPQAIANEHLILVNGAWNVSLALGLAKNFFADPVQGLNGIKQYQSESLKANDALQAISNYFTKNGVFFGAEENGYIFKNNRK